jgi:hypothetical protein
MRVISVGDGFFQMLVLRLDHLIRSVAVKRNVAWSSQLLTRHRLHRIRLR